MNKKCLFAVVIVLVSLICLSACGALRDTADKNKALNESLPYYELNAANYDEISYNGLTYTITDECLEMSELQEEIGQVSKRFKNVAGEDFSFGYVYSIVDVDISNAVAVNINNEYRKADIINNDELVWFQRWEGAKEGDYSREQCYLNKENVTQFSYKGNDYTILADTVSNSGLGEWIGYIQQLAAVDESGKILLQENLKTATFQTLADLADLVDKAPNDAYIIPFLNVYAAPNADDYLIVDINGGYHKAVIDENIKGTDTVFDFKDIEQSMSGKFEINPQNATQLLCDGTVYQVTSDTVSNNELGSYIGILAENVIFNAETKIPLSKEELRKIDWYGENAGQHREQWIYKDIYEIHGTEKTEAVAVQINDRYYIAKRQ